jgi:hypothetical protein
MAVPTNPTLADFYVAAAVLAAREIEAGATPVKLPAGPLIWLLLYRAGIAMEDIMLATDRPRREILSGLVLMLGLLKYPSIAQSITALQKEMPRLPLDEIGIVLTFPGPSTLSFAETSPI